MDNYFYELLPRIITFTASVTVPVVFFSSSVYSPVSCMVVSRTVNLAILAEVSILMRSDSFSLEPAKNQDAVGGGRPSIGTANSMGLPAGTWIVF